MQDLDVLVIGGGIGGLTTAVALLRDGHRVRVLDQARELRPIGAGISLWSNGVKVLDALGLGAGIAAVGGSMERLCYRDLHGTTLCDFSLQPLVDRVGERPYPVRRADLQALLLGNIGDRLTMGQRCTSVEEVDGRVVVHTEAGERHEADLAVVADGTHSKLRSYVVGRTVEREYVGYHNYNGVVPDSAALGDPRSWTVHVGEGKRVSTMPVRDGQYFFFDVPTPDAVPDGTDPQGALRKHFAGWDERVQALIEAIDPPGVATLAIHSHAPIDTYARGNVVLLGDSAHTTAPDLGQGGCLAMEDALVLANYLTTTSVSIADALQRYSAERAPRAARIIERALKRSRLSHAHDPAATEAWYQELAQEDGSSIIGGIAASIETGPCR
ncbi:FAD-dependent monooxygenase [Aquihabitans sp. G128]|uniref:FAD-dependent monooxygenase n=1 Tax=Aquihabitans sp. G128 TaxID=2849779 RepID=UPI001C24CC8D|nr:FAD-dependent monooxygenase [Aquihabitans sp. G128]QXC61063.1 FAD-dependent monooxygenase [Aquihabitans sp. G128]